MYKRPTFQENIDKVYFQIKEVADMLSLPIVTIRYWDIKFKVTELRNPRNDRKFSLKDIERIKLIKRLRYGFGFSESKSLEIYKKYHKPAYRHEVKLALMLLEESLQEKT